MTKTVEEVGKIVGGLEDNNVELLVVNNTVNMDGCVTPDVGNKSSVSPPELKMTRKSRTVESDDGGASSVSNRCQPTLLIHQVM
jgi:hypothetical protein